MHIAHCTIDNVRPRCIFWPSNKYLIFVIFKDLLVPELALCVQKELCSAIPEAEQGRSAASTI